MKTFSLKTFSGNQKIESNNRKIDNIKSRIDQMRGNLGDETDTLDKRVIEKNIVRLECDILDLRISNLQEEKSDKLKSIVEI